MLSTKTLLVVVCGALGVFGCAAPPAEATGQSHARLLAPVPIGRVKALAETTSELGVTEWRLHDGKHATVVTGYAKGKAVVGLRIVHVARTAKSPASMRFEMLDGSRAVATRVAGGAGSTEGSAITMAQAKVLARIAADFAAAPRAKASASRSALGAASLHPLAEGEDACRQTMADHQQDIVTGGLSCLTLAPSPSAALNWLGRALNLIPNTSNCTGHVTGGMAIANACNASRVENCIPDMNGICQVNPSGPNNPCSSITSSPDCSNDSGSKTEGTDTTSSDTANAPATTEDASVSAEATVDDALASGGTCESCPSEASSGADIEASADTGDVSVSDGGGDFGGGGGGDLGGGGGGEGDTG
jgi:hypothetical protein